MFNKIKSWFRNTRAAVSMEAIIGLALALIVAAAVLPDAIVDITNTTTWTGAPAAVITLVPVIGIVAIVAILLMVLRSRR